MRGIGYAAKRDTSTRGQGSMLQQEHERGAGLPSAIEPRFPEQEVALVLMPRWAEGSRQ